VVKKLLILGLAFVLFGPACLLLSIGGRRELRSPRRQRHGGQRS